MPTLPPEPVLKPKDKTEKLARKEAVRFIRNLCNELDGYAYSTRSHMPGGMDFTDFSDG